MSIIEKAANRLEERREKPRLATPAAPQIAALETDTYHGQRPAVVVDRDALRSAGFLAPEDYERRLAEEYRRIKRPLLANAFGIAAAKVPYGNLIMIGSALGSSR